MDSERIPRTAPRKSATFDEYTLSEIRRAAATGIYDIRGAGAKRAMPHFDDLLVLGASSDRSFARSSVACSNVYRNPKRK